MNDEVMDRIQEAAERFADTIKQVAGEKSRVGVFYCFLDEPNGGWYSGDGGNMNQREREGVLAFLLREEIAGIKEED